MKAKLLLKGNNTYSWTKKDDYFFLGYFFDSERRIYRNKEAIEYIVDYLKDHPLKKLGKSIDGLFSIIIKSEHTYILISDSLNYFPLFYTWAEDELIISDEWNLTLEYKRIFQLNKNVIDEFETAGLVLSNDTLDRNIFKTNANQILKIIGTKAEVEQYENFITDTFSDKSFEDLAQESEQILLKVGEKLITLLNGRTAVVPLSGGYDSRLIVSLLKRLKYENVICFTYGKYNPEVPLSEKVAKQLNFDWYFVDFTEINVKEIIEEPEYIQYLEYAANGYAMPYLMEYFAVKELLRDNVIPKDAVFLPGHSGDFLGGSYIRKTVKNNIDFQNLPVFIESKYFNFIRKSRRRKKNIRNRVSKSLENIGNSFIHHGYNMSVEEWDIQEKLSKFIFHSSHVFTFLGFEHFFPLWQKELVYFYRSVPFIYRENKRLYDQVAEECFFRPLGITFPQDELTISSYQILSQKIKDSVRYFLPWSWVLKRVNSADWPYYQKLSENMISFVEEKRKSKFVDFKTYNAVICAWYIELLKLKKESKNS